MTVLTVAALKALFLQGAIPAYQHYHDWLDSFYAKQDNFTLYAAQWNDVNFPGSDLGAGASAPDLELLFGAGAVRGRCFDGTITLEQLYSSGEILHDYKEGTDITFHVHWMPTTNDAGDVRWQLEYNWTNVGDAAVAPLTIGVTAAAGGTAWVHKMSSPAAISGAARRSAASSLSGCFATRQMAQTRTSTMQPC